MRSSFVPRAITVTECLQSPTDYVYLGIYVIPLASKTYKHTADALLGPAAAQKINAAASWLRKGHGWPLPRYNARKAQLLLSENPVLGK